MRRRLDQAAIDVFIIAPPLAAVAWLILLSGRFDELATAILWVLFFIAVRPLIWLWAASRDSVGPGRAAAYRERQRHSVNTAFAASVLIGLAAFDVLPLPGGPYWTSQPRASFALVPVVVYLVWLAFQADIPAEVSSGYKRLFGREEGS
ncbi:MAG TPA: hypothetical protein VGK50_03410 [Coriobacteriia bacterium]